ncbi:uncharacterized protein [Argopecten irradians]|uniref:uncharacterized protein isoform X2 n=1 Tax=Argopecten irradians TaxID=31199 RepID=UPI00371553E5
MVCWILFVIVQLSYTCLAERNRLGGDVAGYVRHVTDGESIYCNPVDCPSGSQLSFCKANFTDDSCLQCPTGCIQPKSVHSRDVVYTTDIPRCRKVEIECMPEAVLSGNEGGTPVCKCDVTRGYWGSDSEMCLKARPCMRGEELDMEGQCTPCPPGTFKPQPGYGPCRPRTVCEDEKRATLFPGNRTSDALCGQYLSTTTLSHVYLRTSVSEITGQRKAVLKSMYHEASEKLELQEQGSSTSEEKDVVKSNINGELPGYVLVIMVSQTLVLLSIFTLVIIATMRIRKLTRELKERIVVQQGEEYIQVSSLCSHSSKKEKAWTLNMVEPPELNTPFIAQPETIGTIYPEINSRPCTPTAPDPSLPFYHNKC